MVRQPTTNRNGVEMKALIEKWFPPDFCWRCGNKLFWFEQIDGPTNLRKVFCDNPIHG